jgi:hypothetical protein
MGPQTNDLGLLYMKTVDNKQLGPGPRRQAVPSPNTTTLNAKSRDMQ